MIFFAHQPPLSGIIGSVPLPESSSLRHHGAMAEPGTLQSMIEAGDGVTAYCIASHDCLCHHSGKVDLTQLVDRLGPGFSIPANHARFIRALRCTRCGRRNAEIRISVMNTGPSKDPMRTVW
ncbi:hypothetical protein [Devosia alba]|uniref:hypothetical protein n=1 Tax=Devosia alba TaxID=3152360 RepID=UPI003267C746